MKEERLDVFHLDLSYEKQAGTACFAPYVDLEVSPLVGRHEPGTLKARIDTGADITCIPNTVARKFMPLLLGRPVLIRGHSGKVERARTHLMVLTMTNPETGQTWSCRPERGVLLTDSNIGLIGMDVLKNFNMSLNGLTQQVTLTQA